jgi:Cro/C1-type HTH DNA-binding domain
MVKLRVRELAEERGLNITELSFRTRNTYSTVHVYWHDTPKSFSARS